MGCLPSLGRFQSECHIEFENALSCPASDLRCPGLPLRARPCAPGMAWTVLCGTRIPRAASIPSRRTAPHLCPAHAAGTARTVVRVIRFFLLPGLPCSGTRPVAAYPLRILPACSLPAPMGLPASPADMFLGLFTIRPVCHRASLAATRWRLPPLHVVLTRDHQPPLNMGHRFGILHLPRHAGRPTAGA